MGPTERAGGVDGGVKKGVFVGPTLTIETELDL